MWSEGSALLLLDSGSGLSQEQKLPHLLNTPEIQVTARSKENSARVLRFTAAVERIDPHSEAGEEALKVLIAARLNADSAEIAKPEWTSSIAVLRVVPIRAIVTPEGADAPSYSAEPARSDATTQDWHPFHFGARPKKRWRIALRERRKRGITG